MAPLISVVVASFNTEKYLSEAVDSIVSQSYSNWQLVFVDDGSTDGSIERMKSLVVGHGILDKVKMFKHTCNYGYGASLFHGIDNSDGPLVAVVDSDDALLGSDALGIMVDAHMKNPSVSMVYSNYVSCFESLSKVMGKVVCTTLKTGESVLGPYKGGRYSGSNVRISHLKTFKKSFYLKTEGVNPFLVKAVDRDLVLKLEEVGPLLHIPDFLYSHRVHGSSISSSFKLKSQKERDKIMDMKLKMYQAAYNRRNGIKHA